MLPLLLLERDVPVDDEAAPFAVVHISVAHPEIAVRMLPDCGCDACDDGSDELLEAIDGTIATVVGGPFVVLRGSGWHAQCHPVLTAIRRRPHRQAVPAPRRS